MINQEFIHPCFWPLFEKVIQKCVWESQPNFSFIKSFLISLSPLSHKHNNYQRMKTKSWWHLFPVHLSFSHFPGCICGVVWWVQTSSQFLVSEDSVWTGCTRSSCDHTGSSVHPEIKLVWSSPVSSFGAAVPLTSTRCCCEILRFGFTVPARSSLLRVWTEVKLDKTKLDWNIWWGI